LVSLPRRAQLVSLPRRAQLVSLPRRAPRGSLASVTRRPGSALVSMPCAAGHRTCLDALGGWAQHSSRCPARPGTAPVSMPCLVGTARSMPEGRVGRETGPTRVGCAQKTDERGGRPAGGAALAMRSRCSCGAPRWPPLPLFRAPRSTFEMRPAGSRRAGACDPDRCGGEREAPYGDPPMRISLLALSLSLAAVASACAIFSRAEVERRSTISLSLLRASPA